MAKKTRRISVIVFLMIFILVFSACAQNDGNGSDQNADAPAEVVEATPAPTPTVEPTPMPTAVPTARPLIEESSEAQPGEYINDSLGLAMEYPAGWEVITEGQSGVELLLVTNPDLTFSYVL